MPTNWKFVNMLLQIRKLKATHELHSGVKGLETFLPDGSGRIIIIPGVGMDDPTGNASKTQSRPGKILKPIPKIWNEWADLERSKSR